MVTDHACLQMFFFDHIIFLCLFVVLHSRPFHLLFNLILSLFFSVSSASGCHCLLCSAVSACWKGKGRELCCGRGRWFRCYGCTHLLRLRCGRWCHCGLPSETPVLRTAAFSSAGLISGHKYKTQKLFSTALDPPGISCEKKRHENNKYAY